jgi:integrase
MTSGGRLAIGEHGNIAYSAKGGRVTARLRYRGHDGRLRRLAATGGNKTAARRRLLKALEEALAVSGSGEYSTRTTFAQVAEEWSTHVSDLVGDGRRSPSTLGLYRHILDNHVLPGVGDLRLSELSASRVDKFIHDKRRDKGYATAKLCRSVMSGICAFAVRRDAMRSNPVRDIAPLEDHGRQGARALTVAECEEWLQILDADPFAVRKDLPDLVRFLLGTGCRLGEAVGVHWDDVDLGGKTLHVRRTVIRVAGQGLVAKRPKTRSGERVLRMPNSVVAMLRARRGCAAGSSPVFPDSVGGYRDRNNIERDFRKVREGTPFDWVVPHTYRKTVATMLDQSGLSARTIADQLGHSRISMTQDIYMGRRAVDEAAAAALDGLMNDQRPDDDDGPEPTLFAVS